MSKGAKSLEFENLQISCVRNYTDSDRDWFEQALNSSEAIDVKILKRRAEVLESELSVMPSYLALPLKVLMKEILSNANLKKSKLDEILLFVKKREESETGLLQSVEAIRLDSFRSRRKIYLQSFVLIMAGLAILYLLFAFEFWYHARYGTWIVNYDQSVLRKFLGF